MCSHVYLTCRVWGQISQIAAAGTKIISRHPLLVKVTPPSCSISVYQLSFFSLPRICPPVSTIVALNLGLTQQQAIGTETINHVNLRLGLWETLTFVAIFWHYMDQTTLWIKVCSLLLSLGGVFTVATQSVLSGAGGWCHCYVNAELAGLCRVPVGTQCPVTLARPTSTSSRERGDHQ